jgi:hypothetical protein
MEGKTAAEVVDQAEIKAIVMAYKGNGGSMSYEQIEKSFGLRRSRGMTAYRVVKKAASMTQDVVKARLADKYEIRTDQPSEDSGDGRAKEESAIDLMMSCREWRQMA